jgi:hypothetical protein
VFIYVHLWLKSDGSSPPGSAATGCEKYPKTALAMWQGGDYSLRSFWEKPEGLWHIVTSLKH